MSLVAMEAKDQQEAMLRGVEDPQEQVSAVRSASAHDFDVADDEVVALEFFQGSRAEDAAVPETDYLERFDPADEFPGPPAHQDDESPAEVTESSKAPLEDSSRSPRAEVPPTSSRPKDHATVGGEIEDTMAAKPVKRKFRFRKKGEEAESPVLLEQVDDRRADTPSEPPETTVTKPVPEPPTRRKSRPARAPEAQPQPVAEAARPTSASKRKTSPAAPTKRASIAAGGVEEWPAAVIGSANGVAPRKVEQKPTPSAVVALPVPPAEPAAPLPVMPAAVLEPDGAIPTPTADVQKVADVRPPEGPPVRQASTEEAPDSLPSVMADPVAPRGEGQRLGPAEKKRRFWKKKADGRERLVVGAPEVQPSLRAAPVPRTSRSAQQRLSEQFTTYRVPASATAGESRSVLTFSEEGPGAKALRCRSCGEPSQWGMCETCSEAFGELLELSASLGGEWV